MVSLPILAALTGTAIVSGFVDSVAGGGGLITVPALLFAGIPPVQALGTNKLQSLFGTGTALRNYWRSGLVDGRCHWLSVAVTFVGGAAGCIAVQLIKPGVLNYVIPGLLIAAALYVLLSPRMTDEDAHHRVSPNGYSPMAATIGFYDGFFGPGTGTFFATTLVALRGYGLTRATAVTKLLNFTSCVASVLFFAVGGKMLWLLGLCMATGAMFGGWLGSHSALRYGARLIRPLLVMISVALTTRVLWSYFG